jgi:hypothetical protein
MIAFVQFNLSKTGFKDVAMYNNVAMDNPALRRVGLGHLAGGDSPRGSPWNGCGWAAETLNG